MYSYTDFFPQYFICKEKIEKLTLLKYLWNETFATLHGTFSATCLHVIK